MKVFGLTCLGRHEFHQVLIADILGGAILGVDITNANGFIIDFKKKNVLRIGQEEVILCTKYVRKSMDLINQIGLTIPPNSLQTCVDNGES